MKFPKFNFRSYLTCMWRSHKLWVKDPTYCINTQKAQVWCLKQKPSTQIDLIPMQSSIRIEGPEAYSYSMSDVIGFYKAGFNKGAGRALLMSIPEKKRFVTLWMWGFDEVSLGEAFKSGVAAGEAALQAENALFKRIRRACSIF